MVLIGYLYEDFKHETRTLSPRRALELSVADLDFGHFSDLKHRKVANGQEFGIIFFRGPSAEGLVPLSLEKFLPLPLVLKS